MPAIRLILLLLTCSLPLAAVTVDFELEATVPWMDPDGYTPVVIDGISHVDQRLLLTVRYRGEVIAEDQLDLVARQRIHHTILTPARNVAGYGLQLRATSSTGQSERYHRNPTIDADDQTTLYVGSDAQRFADLKKARFDPLVECTPATLPHRWQGYRWRLPVLLGPECRRQLDDRQRLALRRFAASGGLVWVVGEPWPELPGITAITPSPDDPDCQIARMAAHHRHSGPAHLERIKVNADTSGGPILFMILSVVFFVVAGPLNLLWAHRRKQLHLLFVSTPLLSGATCLALIVTGLVSEGLSTSRDRIRLDDLPGGDGQAVSWDSISYYAPFAPGSFPIDDLAQALVVDQSSFQARTRYDEIGDGTAIDWRDQQQLTGRWIPSRQARQIVYSQVRPERRRLLIEAEGEGWALTNGLGVGISDFSWLDADGQRWGATAIGAGERRALLPLPARSSLDPDLGRCGPAAGERWQQRQAQIHGFHARLSAPLEEAPGPTAIDVTPVEAWCCGLVLPTEVQE